MGHCISGTGTPSANDGTRTFVLHTKEEEEEVQHTDEQEVGAEGEITVKSTPGGGRCKIRTRAVRNSVSDVKCNSDTGAEFSL